LGKATYKTFAAISKVISFKRYRIVMNRRAEQLAEREVLQASSVNTVSLFSAGALQKL